MDRLTYNFGHLTRLIHGLKVQTYLVKQADFLHAFIKLACLIFKLYISDTRY